jgi:pimeloyl-ACP methyl ester carboxylesterase
VLAAAALGLLALLALTWQPDRPVEALAERWAGPASTFVEIDGLRVHLRDEGPRGEGSEPPVVLLHGTASSLHTWDGWAQALAGERRVIRFDLPGFGLTGPTPDGDYRIARYVEVLFGVLDRLGVERAVLAGNSFGGRVAWNAALRAPERIDALILIDASGYPRSVSSAPIGLRLARVPGLRWVLERSLPRSVIEASVRDVYGDPGRVEPALIDRYFELTLRAGNRRALAARLEQAPDGEGSEQIERLALPVLILWGGRDRLIPPEHGERFAQQIAGSRLIVFPELGHVPQEEDPRRTVDAARAFLAGVVEVPGG